MNLNDLYEKYGKDIKDAADKYKLDECILAGLIWQESRGNPHAMSHCGAYGLTQVMPATQADRGYDLDTPRGQIFAGADYLAWVRDNFANGNITKALAGYNAGPGRIAKDRWKRFAETQNYVVRVPQHAAQYAKVLKTRRFVEKAAEAITILPVERPRNRLKHWLAIAWQRIRRLRKER